MRPNAKVLAFFKVMAAFLSRSYLLQTNSAVWGSYVGLSTPNRIYSPSTEILLGLFAHQLPQVGIVDAEDAENFGLVFEVVQQ